jgi:hypothetical protein
MWIYVQRTGELWQDGQRLAIGYAGWDDGDGLTETGEGKNLPGAEAIRNVGPLPVGRYHICPAENHPRLGPGAMFLEPFPDNEMHGRGEFFMHLDSRLNPGAGSHGCIVLPPAALALVGVSLDRILEVVSEAPPAAQEGIA